MSDVNSIAYNIYEMLDFTSIQMLNRTIIIAHRGASLAYRENSIEAFETAISIGADAIEFDVRRTGDGILIIHHDPELFETGLTISDSQYTDLEKQCNYQNFHLPTLEETLKLCSGKIALDIELKETGYEKDVVSQVFKYYHPANVIFKSFIDTSVHKIKTIAPQSLTCLLLGIDDPIPLKKRIGELFPVSRLKNCQVDFVSPNWKLLKFRFLNRMKTANMPVIVWTVDDIHLAKKLMSQDVAAIITNTPEKLLSINEDSI
ncbi:MAG: glycerophosphodiester phosphodiesterase, partial [Candidatus Zixiibacteriota bacterium]